MNGTKLVSIISDAASTGNIVSTTLHFINICNCFLLLFKAGEKNDLYVVFGQLTAQKVKP